MNKEALKKLETKRKVWKISFIIFAITFVLYCLYTLGGGWKHGNMPFFSNKTIIFVYLFYIVWMFFLYFTHRKLVKQLTNELMQLVLKDEFAGFKYNMKEGVPEQFFRQSKFVDHYYDYTSSNYISGTFETDKHFAMSNIVVTEKSKTVDENGKRDTYTLFKGIFAVLETGQANSFELTIAPDVKNKYLNQLLNSIKKMGGVKNIVRLENVEFERYFEVYSDNQIEARKKITVEFMEKLMLLRKKFNKPITIIYKENKIYLFASDVIIARWETLLWKGLSSKVIEETENTLRDMYDTMKLL